MNDEDLDRLVRQLPSRITPQRDLWPEVEARLQPKDGSTRSWLGRAWGIVRDLWNPENSLRWTVVGVSGLVATLALMVHYVDRSDSDVAQLEFSEDGSKSELKSEFGDGVGRVGVERRAEEMSVGTSIATGVDELVDFAGTEWGGTGMEDPMFARFGEHQVAISLLETIFFDKRKAMDPELAELFRARVALVDEAIEQSQLAFVSNPDDLSLVAYVQDAYQSKLELLDWANSLEE